MTPERWQQVERLYNAALEREASQRAAFLTQACRGDDELRHEVESLLAQDGGASLLEKPALEVAAKALGGDGGPSLLGRQIGGYQVISLLGAGGMGEVYEARDSKLGRKVALKILPATFANDAERLARFQREARMLAALNHPNIATIHGLEQSGGVHYLVMELVPGQTLAERIANGGLPVEEALKIAGLIAEALEAAHEKAVIHRDLKPANVKVTPEGRVKVLDFGLAKAFAGEGTVDLSQAVTLSEEGRILGTPSYMSPEQARGLAVDKRTDIWAFGCVLYEMLTGRTPFAGQTLSDILAAILKHEPDWGALPERTPPKIRDLLRRCLQKDSQRRLRDIGDARLEIEELSAAPANATPAQTAATPVREPWRHAPFWLATCVVLATFTGIAVWKLKPSPRDTPAVARFLLPIPSGVRLSPANFSDSSLSVSPDGTHLAFIGDQGGRHQLYLRTLEAADTKTFQGTDDATNPFFSPDGQWLAFFADGKLKKIPSGGGTPVVLADAGSSRGGNWGDDGTIVFTPSARGAGVFQVSANGGTAKAITTLDSSKGETSHRQPELLPGARAVLFTAYGATYQDVSIVAQSLKSGERHVLIQGASLPHYSPTGHLLYVQPKLPGVVMAVAFDPVNLRVTGTPAPVLQDVLTDRGDKATWSLSRSGMLVYAAGGFQEAENNLVWVDRKGVAAPAGTPLRRPYAFPRISPDERRLVVELDGIQNNLWVYDFPAKTLNRLTFDGNNAWPIWTPDGKRITYASNRSEPWQIFWRLADGSGKEERLLVGPGDQQPYSWSSDGKLLAFYGESRLSGQDVWVFSVNGDPRAQPFLQTAASEVDAAFSPDGRWMSYASDESGRYEVYVQPFTGSGGKWQISPDGGREPLWSRSGREIFYRSGDKMMVVQVATQPAFQAVIAQRLFQGPYQSTNSVSPNYDVSADGQRFLMVQPSEQQPAITEFNVVLNWFEELKRRVPASE